MRAIQRRREEHRRLTNEALGLSNQARVYAGETAGADMLASLLRLPHDGDPYSPLMAADGTPYFMPDYDAVDGDNPIQ